jgi:mRNA interferase MazF
LVIAVPVTTTNRGWPNHVALAGETGLDMNCFAMTEQVRAISRDRITKVTGAVDRTTMQAIDGWLRDFLDLR